MRYINLLVLVPVLLGSGCMTHPVSVSLFPLHKNTHEAPLINNLDIVNAEANVWRGAQPDKKGFEYLKKLGIKTILKLNTDDEASDITAEMMGIKVIKIPISLTHQLLGPIPTEQIKECVLTNQMNLFIHCEHGQDRTGLAVLIYRVAVDNQPKDSELNDMLSHGFHKELLGLWFAAKNF